jgi:V/A-type H+-transporting ATPase subunit I
MAIAKIKKIEIIGLQEEKDKILALLQNLGIVQLIEIQEENLTKNIPLVSSETNLLEIEEAISYLASFQEKKGFFKGLIKPKPLVYEQQLKEVIAHFDYQGLLKELSALRNHLKNLTQHKEHLIQERRLLTPWQPLMIPLDQIHCPTQKCGILLGVLSSRDYLNLLENCKSKEINLFCEAIHQDKTNAYLLILYLQEEFESLEAILKIYHFNFITLTRHKCFVKDRLLEINREVLILEDQIRETKDKIARLSAEQFKLMALYDYLANINYRQTADKNLAKQQFTFCLRGWIKHKDIKLLEKELGLKFKNAVIFISEPQPEEVIPVDLENKRLLQPFEFITKIYGMPKYNEVDPTPFLAPFFFLYFGFCLSDAGYGLMLVLLCWFILRKFSRSSGIPPKAGKLGPQGLRFFRLFFFCGISTIIIGALTGSWFGNLFDLLAQENKLFLPLKRFKDFLIILDPLKEPTKLLGIALSFGIIQVWFGNIVAGIGNFKNKRYLNIILDQVPMLTLLFGLTGLGMIFLRLLDNTHIGLFKNATLLAAIALIFTQGRAEKGVGSKLFYGIYNLYSSLSGYLSDILSYSRLWALGLVTGVMASTINLISIQFSQIFISLVPIFNKLNFIKIFLSSIILIAIFVSGHSVSFLMNILGAFVHPLRLQFVEFFSKFFKSGGDTFRPFKVESKYINLRI